MLFLRVMTRFLAVLLALVVARDPLLRRGHWCLIDGARRRNGAS